MGNIITISTHNGSSVQLKHNRRDKALIEKENRLWEQTHPGQIRIDLNKEHEIWKDENVREAYNQIFGEAQEEFNQRQIRNGHPERCIENYYESLKAKENQRKLNRHPLYEIIYMVGSGKNPVEDTVAKRILKEITADFKARNPNLHVTGIYWHNDESDKGSQHVHLTYFPVAYECTRGMKVQNALKQALKEQGIEGTGPRDTAQMRWEKRENDLLESICKKYGYEVEHPLRDQHVKHLSVEAYKLKKEIEDLQAEIEQKKKLPFNRVSITQARLDELETAEKKLQDKLPDIEKIRQDQKSLDYAMEAFSLSYDTLQKEKAAFDQVVNDSANSKLSLSASAIDAVQFIQSSGLMSAFITYIQKEKAENDQKRR